MIDTTLAITANVVSMDNVTDEAKKVVAINNNPGRYIQNGVDVIVSGCECEGPYLNINVGRGDTAEKVSILSIDLSPDAACALASALQLIVASQVDYEDWQKQLGNRG
jgi:hypothetical protein